MLSVRCTKCLDWILRKAIIYWENKIILIYVSFIGQIIIDATSIKNAYPQQVKVLYIFQFPSVLRRFTAHGPSIFIDWSRTHDVNSRSCFSWDYNLGCDTVHSFISVSIAYKYFSHSNLHTNRDVFSDNPLSSIQAAAVTLFM